MFIKMLDTDLGITNLLILQFFFFKLDANLPLRCSEIKKGGNSLAYTKLLGVFNYLKYRNIEKF